jgi:hypothetical protein
MTLVRMLLWASGVHQISFTSCLARLGQLNCHIQEDKPNPIEPVAEKSIPILLRLFIFILTMNSPKLLLKL